MVLLAWGVATAKERLGSLNSYRAVRHVDLRHAAPGRVTAAKEIPEAYREKAKQR